MICFWFNKWLVTLLCHESLSDSIKWLKWKTGIKVSRNKFWTNINSSEPISTQINHTPVYRILMTRNENSIVYFGLTETVHPTILLWRLGNKETFNWIERNVVIKYWWLNKCFFDNWLKMKVWTMTVGTNIHSLYIEHNHVQFSDVSVQFYTFKENYLYSSVEKFMVPLWNAASQKIDGTCINDERISSYFHWIQSYTANTHSLQYIAVDKSPANLLSLLC